MTDDYQYCDCDDNDEEEEDQADDKEKEEDQDDDCNWLARWPLWRPGETAAGLSGVELPAGYTQNLQTRSQLPTVNPEHAGVRVGAKNTNNRSQYKLQYKLQRLILI